MIMGESRESKRILMAKQKKKIKIKVDNFW